MTIPTIIAEMPTFDWQEKIEFWLKSLKRTIGEEVTKQSKGKESDIPVDPGVYVCLFFSVRLLGDSIV